MSDDYGEFIRRIKREADIVTVISRVTPLKKAGVSYKGLCPFHDEKTPSFNVRPGHNTFHCFGCGAGGTVIDFVMQTERLEFHEAAERLARELGIPIPEKQRGMDAEARDVHEKRLRALEAVHVFALEWFRRNLLEGRHPLVADYLKQRDITPEMSERFQLGAALDGWDHLMRAAQAKGYTRELLVEAGLAVFNEEKRSTYDRFRNRLVFPIFDHLGRIIGFGGRAFDDSKPKYLNSAETDLYKKSRSLYALNIAEKPIVESGYALITEGYMDALMAHRHGFPQTVASLGTALTPEQVRLLKRYTTRVYFMYDGDEAGRRGMLKAGEPLLEAGFDARVILLPHGQDPDDFLKERGTDALHGLRKSAPEFFDFALDELSFGLDMESIAGRTELAQRAAPLLLAIRNDVQRELSVTRLVGRLGGLSREAVLRLIDRQRRTARSSRGESETSRPPVLDTSGPDLLESHALKLMLEDYGALQTLREELVDDWLGDERLRPWIEYFLYGEHDAAHMLTEAEQTGEFPGPREIVNALLAHVQPLGDPEHSARQVAARIRRRHLQRNAMRLLRDLESLTRDNPDEIPQNVLNALYHELLLAFRVEVPQASLRPSQGHAQDSSLA